MLENHSVGPRYFINGPSGEDLWAIAEGIMAIDVSVIPKAVSGNLDAPTNMIAKRGCKIILAA
jgi:hypothetical protein